MRAPVRSQQLRDSVFLATLLLWNESRRMSSVCLLSHDSLALYQLITFLSPQCLWVTLTCWWKNKVISQSLAIAWVKPKPKCSEQFLRWPSLLEFTFCRRKLTSRTTGSVNTVGAARISTQFAEAMVTLTRISASSSANKGKARAWRLLTLENASNEEFQIKIHFWAKILCVSDLFMSDSFECFSEVRNGWIKTTATLTF